MDLRNTPTRRIPTRTHTPDRVLTLIVDSRRGSARWRATAIVPAGAQHPPVRTCLHLDPIVTSVMALKKVFPRVFPMDQHIPLDPPSTQPQRVLPVPWRHYRRFPPYLTMRLPRSARRRTKRLGPTLTLLRLPTSIQLIFVQRNPKASMLLARSVVRKFRRSITPRSAIAKRLPVSQSQSTARWTSSAYVPRRSLQFSRGHLAVCQVSL